MLSVRPQGCCVRPSLYYLDVQCEVPTSSPRLLRRAGSIRRRGGLNRRGAGSVAVNLTVMKRSRVRIRPPSPAHGQICHVLGRLPSGMAVDWSLRVRKGTKIQKSYLWVLFISYFIGILVQTSFFPPRSKFWVH